MITGFFSKRSKRFNSHFDGIKERLTTMGSLFEAAFSNDKTLLRVTQQNVKSEEEAILTVIESLRNETGNSLLTPIDREDIHYLTGNLKLLAGNIVHITGQLKHLNHTQLPKAAQTTAPMIAGVLKSLAEILGQLKNISKLKELTESCLAVRQTLYQCDVLLDDATAVAINTIKDTLELIKITDHFAALQRLLEKAGDVVDNSETIIIKYS